MAILMKKFVRCVVGCLIASAAHMTQAKSGPEIQFLDTYDQLAKCIGQEGHWFVRDAANTRTGQHGDPTVQKGWAIYTWDVLITGWRKICEEESLDNSVNEALLRQYVKTSTFDQALRDIAQKYVSLAQHNSDVQLLNNSIRRNTSSISALSTDLTKTKSNLAVVEQKADYAKSETVRIREMIESLDIETIRVLLSDSTNRVHLAEQKIGGLERTVTSVTNLVYGFDDRIVALEVKTADHTEIIAATTNTIRLLDASVKELRSEMNGVLDDIPNLFAGLNTQSQRVDVVEQKIDGIIEQAKSYTDSKVDSLKEEVITRDAGILSSANEYADNKASDAVQQAKSHTNSKVGELSTKINDEVGKLTKKIEDGDATALSSANSHTDTLVAQKETELRGIVSDVLSVANSHTDTLVSQKETEFHGIVSDMSDKVYADMKIGDANTLHSANAYTDEKVKNVDLGPYVYSGTVRLGAGSTNEAAYAHKGSVLINPNPIYPSTVGSGFTDTNRNSYAISIGADNKVATTPDSRYAIAIGTSDRAVGIHSYAFGSQINALSPNTTVIGYSLTATDPYSIVIGHGNRSVSDISFTGYQEMTNFFRNVENKDQFFVGEGIVIGGGPGCDFIVDAVYAYPDSDTGMYVKLRVNPDDIEVGRRKWFYGKSHGNGTFNIVAIGDSVNDYGFAKVYVNDRSLADWTGIHIGEPTEKPIYNKGIFGPETTHCSHDYTISIGDNARALESSDSCQSIAIGRDSLSVGNATTAIGPNAFAYGSLATALGWRANAIGDHSIAIGNARKSGQNYFVDGAINENSDLCAAIGSDSIAIGYNTKSYGNRSVSVGYYANSKADNAVQIGTGTNTTPNSVKFYDTEVFKDGKLVGTFDSKDLDPIENVIGENMCITARAHTVNTLSIQEGVSVDEIEVIPEGSRNFEIYIPNDESARNGMPILMDSGIPEVKHKLWLSDDQICSRLPAMIKVQQPRKDTILFTLKMLDDGWDWTPGVTNVCFKWDTTEKKFYTEGKSALYGTNLHMAVTFKLTYPTSSSTTKTVDLLELDPKETYKVGTLFNMVGIYEHTPTAEEPLYFDGDTSWFELEYETVNGRAEISRQLIDLVQ